MYLIRGNSGRCIWLTLSPSCSNCRNSGSLSLLERYGYVQACDDSFSFAFHCRRVFKVFASVCNRLRATINRRTSLCVAAFISVSLLPRHTAYGHVCINTKMQELLSFASRRGNGAVQLGSLLLSLTVH
jgi:hypothetical protein